MPIDAVIFDWGGTLAYYAEVELKDMWRLAARHIAPDREAEVTAQLTAVEVAYWARTETDQRSSTLAELLAEARETIGVDVAEAVFEEAATHYLDSWTPHIRHDPDAAPMLAGLRARGIRTALLSNTHWPRAFHEHFLERDGLAELLDARLYSSELPYMKPHPSTFEAALAALGVTDPARAVFVGDRPYDDVYGAQRLGMRGVLRPNPSVPPFEVTPAATIDRLPELLGHIDRWNALGG
ncbi:MAG: HAD family hydrolase [Chloroflexi bacterium]|nr:MAG: HAD family hydrolase [Chloroflexota bacterium]